MLAVALGQEERDQAAAQERDDEAKPEIRDERAEMETGLYLRPRRSGSKLAFCLEFGPPDLPGAQLLESKPVRVVCGKS